MAWTPGIETPSVPRHPFGLDKDTVPKKTNRKKKTTRKTMLKPAFQLVPSQPDSVQSAIQRGRKLNQFHRLLNVRPCQHLCLYKRDFEPHGTHLGSKSQPPGTNRKPPIPKFFVIGGQPVSVGTFYKNMCF